MAMQGGITITDTSMRSSATRHTATATGEGWEVSWLPGRTFTRAQATTAMIIANLVGGRGVGHSDDPIWAHLDNWAAELDLSGPDAVVRASEPPGAREAETGQEPEAGA
jgi:hypothetical protein